MVNNIFSGFHIPTNDYYKVYVRSITYNQSPYIDDCLNGVTVYLTNLYPLLWNNNSTEVTIIKKLNDNW